MHHWGYFHPFAFIFPLLFIAFFAANFIMWSRRGRFCFHGNADAQVILAKRLASGEIGVEEFEKINEILKKK